MNKLVSDVHSVFDTQDKIILLVVDGLFVQVSLFSFLGLSSVSFICATTSVLDINITLIRTQSASNVG